MVSLLAAYGPFKASFRKFRLKEVEAANDFVVGDYMAVYVFSECVLLRRNYTGEASRNSRIQRRVPYSLKLTNYTREEETKAFNRIDEEGFLGKANSK